LGFSLRAARPDDTLWRGAGGAEFDRSGRSVPAV
jgi:hypothetical protein